MDTASVVKTYTMANIFLPVSSVRLSISKCAVWLDEIRVRKGDLDRHNGKRQRLCHISRQRIPS
jgi:hypothetical protein